MGISAIAGRHLTACYVVPYLAGRLLIYITMKAAIMYTVISRNNKGVLQQLLGAELR